MATLRPAGPAPLGLLLAVLLLTSGGATARRLRRDDFAEARPHRQLLERRSALETCTGCLTKEPSKPLPQPSDELSAAAADLSWLVDPIRVIGGGGLLHVPLS